MDLTQMSLSFEGFMLKPNGTSFSNHDSPQAQAS
jgi:hypothetical protein